MDGLLQDLRYAFRTLGKARGFTAVIVGSLALAFAANTTVFSIANGLLWGMLPVPNPERVVMFSEGRSFSYPDYVDYSEQTKDVFEGGVAAHFPLVPASLGGRGEPERVWGQVVSGNYFPVLGLRMALGRPVLPEDDRVIGRDHVVVLSHDLWRRRFAQDAAAVGRDVVLNGRHFTVIGVAPAGFHGSERGIVCEFWTPLAVAPDLMPAGITPMGAVERAERDSQWLLLDARLRPGVTRAAAAAAVNVVKRRIDEAYGRKDERRGPVTLETAGGLIAGSATPVSTLSAVLMVVVGLLLLVACANVANLLLGRAAGRRKEIALRQAVGASRRQLVRQLLTESLVLATAGATLGFALAALAARGVSRFKLPLPVPIVFDFDVDLRVAAFTLGLSLVTALLFGLAPALRASHPDLVRDLKDALAAGRARRGGMHDGLVIVQVALSLVLLATAGLFLRSLGNASSIDVGFRADNTLLVAVDPKVHGYSRERTMQFLTQLRERVSALPGVAEVSFVDTVPLSGAGTSNSYGTDAPGEPGQRIVANVYNVGPRYFETLGIPFVGGRDFSTRADEAGVVVINATAARQAFGRDAAVGRSLRAGHDSYRVIGVVRDSKSRWLGETAKGCVYFPLLAAPERADAFFGVSAVVKTTVGPRLLERRVRDEIAALDPTLAVFNVETMQEHLGKALLLPRVSALLLGTFGAVGLTLAAMGLYGVISSSVRRRTREIGIRMALGARPGAVLRAVLGQGLVLTGIGLAIGLGASLALGRFTARLLYGISGTDPLTFTVVSLVLAVTAVAAVLVPATRAARVAPAVALRCD